MLAVSVDSVDSATQVQIQPKRMQWPLILLLLGLTIAKECDLCTSLSLVCGPTNDSCQFCSKDSQCQNHFSEMYYCDSVGYCAPSQNIGAVVAVFWLAILIGTCCGCAWGQHARTRLFRKHGILALESPPATQIIIAGSRRLGTITFEPANDLSPEDAYASSVVCLAFFFLPIRES